MAYHVRVILNRTKDKFVVEGQWSHQLNYEFFSVEPQRDMTAAESIEYYFLERDMVPSWIWWSTPDGKALNCEFVFTHNLNAVEDSLAYKFDL